MSDIVATAKMRWKVKVLSAWLQISVSVQHSSGRNCPKSEDGIA
jgi:hypothetical protein